MTFWSSLFPTLHADEEPPKEEQAQEEEEEEEEPEDVRAFSPNFTELSDFRSRSSPSYVKSASRPLHALDSINILCTAPKRLRRARGSRVKIASRSCECLPFLPLILY
jgi:hypothetical protein